MNSYPSWIHRIPEMLEVLALLPDERIDRRRAEELFDLRRRAAHELLRRFGAERHGNALAISRGKLMARLRELQEHPDWRWERERREQIRARIDTLRPNQRPSLVPVGEGLQQQIDLISMAGLPDTVRFAAGRLGRVLERNRFWRASCALAGSKAKTLSSSWLPYCILRSRWCSISFPLLYLPNSPFSSSLH